MQVYCTDQVRATVSSGGKQRDSQTQVANGTWATRAWASSCAVVLVLQIPTRYTKSSGEQPERFPETQSVPCEEENTDLGQHRAIRAQSINNGRRLQLLLLSENLFSHTLNILKHALFGMHFFHASILREGYLLLGCHPKFSFSHSNF